MKKADIFVIIFVFLLSVTFYGIYFSNNKQGDDLGVEIYYQGKLIYEAEITEDINSVIYITSKSNSLFVKIDLYGDGKKIIEKSPMVISESHEIVNTVKIQKDNIRMTDANCDNHLCMNMRIGGRIASPIFCTNGILIKLVTNDYRIIV